MKTTISNIPILFQRQPHAGLFAIVATCLITGCSDPADKVAKSPATAPQETAKPGAAGKSYVIRAESSIGFVGSKVTGSHNGGFKKFAGKVSAADGAVIAAEVKIAMDSTWADNELTGHLKSPDFFDAAKYPVATFTVTDIKPSSAQKTVTGNLELHGVTKSITFPADVQVADDAITVKAEFAINRKDFNIQLPGQAERPHPRQRGAEARPQSDAW